MDDFWAITAYFNPMGYGRRRRNYHTFRKHLTVPLITVEWAWGDAPFALTRDDADVLIQVRSPDLLWQKERLLNIAIAALPADCRCVAWLDCDIVFENPRWHTEAAALLRDTSVVHLFDTACDLSPAQAPPLGNRTPFRTKQSLLAFDMPPEGIFELDFDSNGVAGGHAWAARADLLRKHGLYDAMIVGGGDRAIVHACIGRFDELADRHRLNPRWDEHYRDWAARFHADVQGRPSFVPGRLLHLWHGWIENRLYVQRHEDLAPHRFDPRTDIAVDPAGPWRWSSNKPKMHAYLRDYFAHRCEDGKQAEAARV